MFKKKQAKYLTNAMASTIKMVNNWSSEQNDNPRIRLLMS